MQNIRRFIDRLLRAAQRVPGSRIRPSEQGLRTTSLRELDRQSQPSRRGCHSREVRVQTFTFPRRFGTASIFSTVFSMHSIGFQLRESQGCGVGNPVIGLLAIAIIRLRLQTDSDL